MNAAKIFFLVGLAACSRASTPVTADAASPNTVNSAAILDAANSPSAAIDAAAAARADCAEPKKLTQLKTVDDVATFSGESLVGQTHAYDPETLAASALPPPKPHGNAITPSRYASIVNGVGLIVRGDMDGASVEDVTTHKAILAVGPCAAGGTWVYSLSTTARFLICETNREGKELWDLRVAHPSKDKPVDAGWMNGANGEGLSIAPNDSYAVAVPVHSWGNGEPTRSSITYFDLDARKTKPLGKATLDAVDAPNGNQNPYAVAFCGDGALFVASDDKDVVVYRGRDGARLAAAPAMKGGLVSFSESGRYISQSRNQKTTVFRLDL